MQCASESSNKSVQLRLVYWVACLLLIFNLTTKHALNFFSENSSHKLQRRKIWLFAALVVFRKHAHFTTQLLTSHFPHCLFDHKRNNKKRILKQRYPSRKLTTTLDHTPGRKYIKIILILYIHCFCIWYVTQPLKSLSLHFIGSVHSPELKLIRSLLKAGKLNRKQLTFTFKVKFSQYSAPQWL